MTLLRIQLIVEGHSEAECLNSLVIRYLQQQGIYDVMPTRAPINTKGCGNLKGKYKKENHRGIEYFVSMASRKRPDAILILLDADDECLKRQKSNESALGPWLLERTREYSRGIPIRVAVANREFEAWLVAGWPDNRITQHDRKNAENRAGYAKKIEDALGRKYSKTSVLPEIVNLLPFEGDVLTFAPSYARFLRVVRDLANEARNRKT